VLLRSFIGGGEHALVRAVLSNAYAPFDNLDAVMAVLRGIREAGVVVEVQGADLTEGRMDVRFVCPTVSADIADLVKDYRPSDHKVVPTQLFAGFRLTNGETGGAAFKLSPRVVVAACSNGLVVEKDVFSKRHVGERLEEGAVTWSERTIQTNIDLITSKTADIVKTVLTETYVEDVANRMRTYKGIEVTKPMETVKVLGKTLKWSDAEIDSLVSTFVAHGDLSVLGIGQAVTFNAQKLPTGEAQDVAESGVWAVLDAAKKAVALVG
jgi:hypothetical protein